MSITISGLGTGLPIDTWISKFVSIKQAEIDTISAKKTTVTSANSDLSTIKGNYSSLLTSLQSITDSLYGTSSDLFAKNSATTSDATTVGASVTSQAARQSLSVTVSQLASSTVAQTPSGVTPAATVSSSTKITDLSNGQGTAGTLSVYVDNKKYSINVTSSSTVGSVLSDISSQTGLKAGIQDGKIYIGDADINSGETPSSTKNIVIGSTSDTTNFSSVLALSKNTDGGYQSNQKIYTVNTNATLTSADAGFSTTIKAGSFKIGNDTFTIDSSTTLSGLISKINTSDSAGVSAYWDSTSSKLVLTSKTQGAYNINVENISGNFTDVMGLTTSTYDTDGNVTSSQLATGSQKVGDNAILTVNNTTIISSSNTVTSDISGLTGVTLTLKGKTTSATTIKVSQDTSDLTTAVNSFISSFNTVITNTDTVTKNGGSLYGESTLVMIRDGLRQTSTAALDTGSEKYDSLAMIGITTGAVGAGLSDNTNKLQIDATKFANALADDPAAVKKLLIGDGTTDGVLTKLKAQVNSALDNTNGYFVARAKTFSDQISDLNDQISTKTTALTEYQKELETKFSAMDSLISKMNNQYSSLASTLGISTSSSSSKSSSS